jgi:transmembrane sensor
MPKDLIERYNHLRYKNSSSIEEQGFVDFLYENTNTEAPEIDENEAWKNVARTINRKTTASYGWLKIAASVAVILSISFFVWNNKVEPEQLFISSTDQKIEVTFPDGSKGVLNEQSSFSFLEKFTNERRVAFKGEAYFDIKKSTKPFIIDVDGVEVRVLGTAFNLNSTEDHVELFVERGLVAFVKDGVQTNVEAGLEATFNKKDFSVKISQNPSSNSMSWRNGTFNFDNTPLPEALSQLEEFYNVSFKLSNDAISNCKITATFDKRSLKEVIEAIETLLTVKTTKTGNKVKISGAGC